ncbi:MAG: hypothetical protein K6G80_04005 [Treponema sp.]|nr:hypothetical protein [Treponema sp.]
MKKVLGVVAAAVSGIVMIAGCASSAGAGGSAAGFSYDFSKFGQYDAISPNAQENVKVGQDEEHGKFLSFDFTGSTANSRGAYYHFKGSAPADPVYVVEFDASLKSGNNHPSEFTIYGTDWAARDMNGGSDKGWLIKMTAEPKAAVWTVNSTKQVEIPAGKWVHFKLLVDRNQKLVSTVVTYGGEELTNKTVTGYNGNGAVKGVYMKAGRYQAVFNFDNLVIRAAQSDETIGELGEEELVGSEFTATPAAIVKPAEAPADYVFSFKAVGDRLGDLTAKANVKWNIVGIDTKDPAVTVKTEGANATITVAAGAKTHIAIVKASATIGDKTVESSAPFVILNAAATAGQLIPAPGYPASMNDYDSAMVGYKATATGIKDRDPVLNNWSIYGSNGARALTLVEQDGIKSLQFDSNRGGGSTLGVYQWTDQKKKFVVEATLKYDSSMEFGIWGVNTPNNTNSVKYASIYAGGGMVMIGSSSIMNVNPKVFYKYVMTVDPAAKTYTVAIYNLKGDLIGKSDATELGATQGRYLCVTGAFPVNVAFLKAYTVETAE